MDDIEIRFERENIEGIVPVGTYLIDAAKRLGVRLPDGCDAETNEHSCEITVTAGGDLLSPMTSAETTYFSAGAGAPNRRLADQARIDKPGEIVIMTAEKKAQKAAEEELDDKNEQYKKAFSDMPLEKKIASLVQLEAIALGETFSFILNSPYMIFDKAMDVMAEFGLKKEESSRRSARPEEHAADAPTEQKKEKQHGRAKRANKSGSAE